VLIRLLGTVDVEGGGTAPASKSHRRTATEILALLSLRDGAVGRRELIDALWPEGRLDAAGRPLPQPSRKTLFAHISRARTLAGLDPAGRPHLAEADPGDPLHLSARVGTDYQLFCRLRDAVWDRAGPDLVTGIQAALDLVAGPPPRPEARHGAQDGWLHLLRARVPHSAPTLESCGRPSHVRRVGRRAGGAISFPWRSAGTAMRSGDRLGARLREGACRR
jgi:hypothetical protein